MPPKKRQHYVPKFYLRNFSIGAMGKSVGIYNIPGEKFIPSGSLKEQAYKDYFYGKDGKIEDIYQKFETRAAIIIRDIIKRHIIPVWASNERLELLMFATFLHSRTEYAADEYEEQKDQFLNTLYSNDNDKSTALKDDLTSYTPASAEIFRSVSLCTPLAADLQYKIIINDTSVPFITSDNPSVYYNRFLEGRNTHGSNIGLGVKGFQIFLPISPKYLLLLFDSGVYNIGKVDQLEIVINDEYDINGLNYLQCASSYYNLYFNECIKEPYISYIAKKMDKFRRIVKSFTKEYVQTTLPDGSSRSILHTYKNDLRINLNLSFVRITAKAKKYKLGNRAVHPRNDLLYTVYTEFIAAVNRQEYEFDEWDQFYQDYINRVPKSL